MKYKYKLKQKVEMVLAGMQNTVKYLNKDNLSCLEFVLPDQTNAESAYMFSLGVRNILCSGRSLYEYKRESQTWSKLKAEMKDIRTEVGCISVKDGVIISGGTIWDYDGSEIQGSHCTDSVVSLQNDFSVVVCIFFMILSFSVLCNFLRSDCLACSISVI